MIKKIMKQCAACLALAALSGCLAACGLGGEAAPAATDAPSPAVILPAETGAPSAPAAAQTPEAPAGDDEAREAGAAYLAALTALLDTHVLPDGTDVGYDQLMDDGGNRFAIYDVDKDGRDELILLYTSTYMAGQTAGVYAYDAAAKRLRAELTEFPMLTFFDNGVIKAGWSHNQGLGGSFWPYTLYRYDAAADSYACVGMADAWDRSLAEKDFDGNPFPADVDQSGAGIVYYLIPGAVYEQVPPADAAAYEAWYAAYLDGAAEEQLPFMPLTKDSLNALR